MRVEGLVAGGPVTVPATARTAPDAFTVVFTRPGARLTDTLPIPRDPVLPGVGGRLGGCRGRHAGTAFSPGANRTRTWPALNQGQERQRPATATPARRPGGSESPIAEMRHPAPRDSAPESA